MKSQQDRGFTIVELLIVIVVIAILAAVSIVAFNGMQVRAENTKTINGVAALVKTVASYKAAKGNYPVAAMYPCIGQTGTVCGVTPASPGCWGIGYVPAYQSFNDDLKTINTNIPEVSKQSMDCSNGSKATGAFYYSLDGSAYVIYYFLKGNVDCGSPGGINIHKEFSINTTRCNGPV